MDKIICQDSSEKCLATDCCSAVTCNVNDGTKDHVSSSPTSPFSNNNCPNGFVIRGSLDTVACSGVRCTHEDCCQEIYCNLNSGQTNTLDGPYQDSRCVSEKASGWTLTRNQESIQCMAADKICTADECCDPPITCANNDGSGSGVTTTSFDDNACKMQSRGGSDGYTLKTGAALSTYGCTSNGKKCSASICCDPPVYCSNNDGTGNGYLNIAFKPESCTLTTPFEGKPGYIIKSYLAGVSCSADGDRVCKANECCELITCDVNNG